MLYCFGQPLLYNPTPTMNPTHRQRRTSTAMIIFGGCLIIAAGIMKSKEIRPDLRTSTTALEQEIAGLRTAKKQMEQEVAILKVATFQGLYEYARARGKTMAESMPDFIEMTSGFAERSFGLPRPEAVQTLQSAFLEYQPNK